MTVVTLHLPAKQEKRCVMAVVAGNCIVVVSVFKHNQQDTTLHNGVYYYKCSASFRHFLCPSSGAQNYTQHWVFVKLFLLLTAIVSELELTHDSGK